MRCAACDEALNDREATRKFLFSGKFCDLCTKCLSTISDDAPTEDDIPLADDVINSGEKERADD